MAGEVLMSLKEVDRDAVIELVLRRTMEQSDAALWLGVSVRHVKRLIRAARDQGTDGVISRRCGVPSSTAAYLDSLQRYASEHGRLVSMASHSYRIRVRVDRSGLRST